MFRLIDLARETNNESFVPLRPMTSRMLELWILCHLPQRAEKFLKLREEISAISQFKELRARADQFRYLLISWASNESIVSIDSSHNAERLLHEMNERYLQSNNADWRPSANIISMVIASWTRTDYPDLVGKCMGLLDYAFSLYAAGNEGARPDVAMYCTVLHAYVRTGDGFGAMRLVGTMLRDYHENHNDSAKPNTRVFNMILQSWVRSKDLSAPHHALEVFQMMQSLSFEKINTEPDFRTFSLMSAILQSATSTELMEKRKFFLEQRDLIASKRDE
jgi:Pentatricopeptide repeat domain